MIPIGKLVTCLVVILQLCEYCEAQDLEKEVNNVHFDELTAQIQPKVNF